MGTETRQEPPVTFTVRAIPDHDHDEKQVVIQLANALKLNRENAPVFEELKKQSWFNPHVALRNHHGAKATDVTIEDIKRLRQDPLLNQRLLERIIEYMETFPPHFWTAGNISQTIKMLRVPCV